MSTGVARVNDAASLVHRSKQVGLDIVKPSGTGFRFFPVGNPPDRLFHESQGRLPG
jgi:hypothetical protein